MKFFVTKKPIFNRGFIVYSLNEKDTVPPELIKERENEDAGIVKKSPEQIMKQTKERMETGLADRLRAILFLMKNVHDGKNSITQMD